MILENTPKLETADLILRRFTENDLHAVLRKLSRIKPDMLKSVILAHFHFFALEVR